MLVTGASGGVGSMAISLLAGRGYEVVASTGKADEHGYLRSLGASEVIGREDLAVEAGRVLGPERWAGVIDCVGGATLASVIRSTRYGGAGRGVWADRRHRPRHHCVPVHPPRRGPPRSRLGPHGDRGAPGSLGTKWKATSRPNASSRWWPARWGSVASTRRWPSSRPRRSAVGYCVDPKS